jgi:hypothetical protein
MAFNAGDVFLARLPDGSTVCHLCVALTNEGGICSTVFVVPVMTPTPKSDRTTMLPTSVCPEFLKYESYVAYSSLVERETARLEALIERRHMPIDAAWLKLVVSGAFQSPLTPRGVRERLKERLRDI